MINCVNLCIVWIIQRSSIFQMTNAKSCMSKTPSKVQDKQMDFLAEDKKNF